MRKENLFQLFKNKQIECTAWFEFVKAPIMEMFVLSRTKQNISTNRGREKKTRKPRQITVVTLQNRTLLPIYTKIY